jgi:hypothetical protein
MVISHQNSFLLRQKSKTDQNTQLNSKEEEPAAHFYKPNKVLLSRVIMFNTVSLLLKDYTHDEMRFVNFNYPM